MNTDKDERECQRILSFCIQKKKTKQKAVKCLCLGYEFLTNFYQAVFHCPRQHIQNIVS